MTTIDFLTAVTYGDQSRSWGETFLEGVDDFFYMGGEKAHVIPLLTYSGDQCTILCEAATPSMASTACKILAWIFPFPFVIPLVLFVTKVIIRYRNTFHKMDPVEELGRDLKLNLTQQTIQDKIQTLFLYIHGRRDAPRQQLTWINSKCFKVFSLPGMVFKVGDVQQPASEKRVKDHFAHMVTAKKICMAHRLNQLIIPSARLIEIKHESSQITLIAQNEVQFSPNQLPQKNRYRIAHIDGSIRQLTTLIAKTGLRITQLDEIPLFDQRGTTEGIFLMNMETVAHPTCGIFGTSTHPGLIGLMQDARQIDAVLNEAARLGITPPLLPSGYSHMLPSTPEAFKTRRLQQIGEERRQEQTQRQAAT